MGDRRRSLTRGLARWVALHGPGWAACRAVAWLGRPDAVAHWATAGSYPPAWDARDDLMTLQQVVEGANGPQAAERAATLVEELWSAGSEHRTVLWTVLWNCPLLSTEAISLLLALDPNSPHEPRVRLVSGLPVDTGDPTAEEIGTRVLYLACRVVDREVGDRVADVLRRTDHPLLLRLLATDFARALQLERSSPSWRSHCERRWWGERGANRLWRGDRAEPLLGIVLANPHLPPPRMRLGEFGRHERVMLQVLRDRVDLLDDGLVDAVLVESALRYLDGATASPPAALLTACRRVLRSLPPGPGREALCEVVLTQPEFVESYENYRYVHRRSAEYAEAIAAVTDTGHLPADPASVPRFLLRSRQWERFAGQDPTGEQLYAFCGQALSRDPEEAKQTARILLDLAVDVDAPAALRDAGRRALRDVGPGAVRDLLHRRAKSGNVAAARIVDAEDERRYRQAADAGDAAAMSTLGLFLSERGEPNEAEQWYNRAVDAGNCAALNNMGFLLEQRRDLSAAAQWYRQAADAGSVLSMVNLGNLSTRTDPAEAEHWYRRAVDAGPQQRDDERFRAFGAAGDLSEAEKRWRHAGDTAYITAMDNIGFLHYRRGELSEAEAWWRRAAELGNGQAMSNLGVLCERRGDLAQATRWYTRAAAAGNSLGQSNLRELRRRRNDSHRTEARGGYGIGSSDYGGGHYGGFGGSY